MANRTTIRCNVCGCETAVVNIQPGSKVFCLHCGRLITDSYQPGMEFQPGLEYQQGVNYQQSAAFNQPPQSFSKPEDTVIPPPIDNSFSQQGNAPEPPQPQPNWMTEPYIRVNWKRIGYTIKTVFKGVCSFFSKRWAEFREGLRSDGAPSTETLQRPGEQQNGSPAPGPASQQQAPEPETPFGYVDRRQARMQQSFSRNFADSGAIPASPPSLNYSQQRIDQSFTKSFQEDENKQA